LIGFNGVSLSFLCHPQILRQAFRQAQNKLRTSLRGLELIKTLLATKDTKKNLPDQRSQNKATKTKGKLDFFFSTAKGAQTRDAEISEKYPPFLLLRLLGDLCGKINL